MARLLSLVSASIVFFISFYVTGHMVIAKRYDFSPKLGTIIAGTPGKIAIYTPVDVFHWYRSAFLNDILSQKDFLISIYVPIGICLICFIVIDRTIRRPNKGPKTTTERGLDSVSDKELFKLAEKLPRSERGIKLHPKLPVSRDTETQGFLVFGGTGSGKTKSCINYWLKQAADQMSQGNKIVVLDSKGDFTPAYAELPNVKIVAPWDNRSVHLDLAATIKRGPLDANLLANALIPTEPREAQPFFRDAARYILTGVLTSLHFDGNLSWDTLRDTVADKNKLNDVLNAYDFSSQAAEYMPKTDKDRNDVKSNLNNATWWLYFLAKAWKTPNFNLRDWLNDEKGGMLILRYSEGFPDLSRSLCAMVTSVLISEILSWPVSKAKAVWWFLDELGNLPKINNLAAGISAGRERGSRFVVCTQGPSQLFKVYGPDEGQTFLNNLTSLIVFGMNGEKDRETAANCLGGEREQVYTTYSEGKSHKTFNLMNDSISNNESTSYRVSKLVLPSQLQALKKGQAFVKVAGFPVASLQWPMTLLDNRFEAENMAPWVTQKDQRKPPVPEQKPEESDGVTDNNNEIEPSKFNF